MKKIVSIFLVFLFLITSSLNAQTSNPDFMHSIGKIYAVVAVLAVIFIGIIIFLFYLERKLTRLESQIEE